MKLEIDEIVELGIILISFMLLVAYFGTDYREIARQLLIWILATSTTLLVIGRVKKYVKSSFLLNFGGFAS